MNKIQKDIAWKTDFIDYTFSLLNNDSQQLHELIYFYGCISEHLGEDIYVGEGYVFETPEEYAYYVGILHEKLVELKNLIDATNI